MIHEKDFRNRAQIVRQSARAHLLEIRQARLARRGGKAPLDLEHVEHASEAQVADAVLELASVAPQQEEVAALAEVSPPPPEVVAALAEQDDIDTLAHRNLFDAPPNPDERLTVPSVDSAITELVQDMGTMVKKAVRRKPAKVKAVKPSASAADVDDRAVQSAALADLAAEAPPMAGVTIGLPPPVDDALQPDTIEGAPSTAVADGDDHVASADIAADHSGEVLGLLNQHPPQAESEAASPPRAAANPTEPVSDLFQLPGTGPGLVWMLQQCGINSLQDLAHAQVSELISRLGLVGQILNVEIWQDYARKAT